MIGNRWKQVFLTVLLVGVSSAAHADWKLKIDLSKIAEGIDDVVTLDKGDDEEASSPSDSDSDSDSNADNVNAQREAYAQKYGWDCPLSDTDHTKNVRRALDEGDTERYRAVNECQKMELSQTQLAAKAAREADRAAKRERERLAEEERSRIAAEQRAQEEADEQALAASLIEEGKFRLACRISPKDEYFSSTYIFQFRNADQSGSFREYTLTTIADPDAIEYGRNKWEDFRFLNDDNKTRFLEIVEEARKNDLRTLRNWESFYSVTPQEYVLDGNKVYLLEEVIPTWICQEQGLKQCVRFGKTPAINRRFSYYESEHGNAPCKVSPESPEALINSHYDGLLEWWESKETAARGDASDFKPKF